MSHEYSAKTNKYPKVPNDQYLYNVGEPLDSIFNDTPAESEIELQGNSHTMRQHLRHTAQMMRSRYL